VAALVSNTLRIAVLAIGIARPDYFGGADVMAQPWYDPLGSISRGTGIRVL
jgi:hypothetical protein